MRITKALIAAAGLGTRLLPATKEQPKEMLPIFALTKDNTPCLKPVLQLVFEQIYDAGFREFCFVIGKGKQAIWNHFVRDDGYLCELERKGKDSYVEDLRSFYERLDNSMIVWVNQPTPLGFGDAVRMAKAAIGSNEFLVHAGDTYIISDGNQHFSRLLEVFEKFGASATFLVKRMKDTSQRGVVDAERVAPSIYQVNRAVEKPTVFLSDLAIEPVYVFQQEIFEALENTRYGSGGELQLTDAIQTLVSQRSKVYAVELNDEDLRLDIGDYTSYREALQSSSKYVSTELGEESAYFL